MKKIGLTGGIGVGKTFVASIFQKMGIAVFSADIYAKRCMQESEQLKNAIIQHFGTDIYKNEILQKQKLAEIVFSDSEKLNVLNKLVHPFVQIEFEKWCKNQTSSFVLKEAAILFESDSNKNLDAIICVGAPLQIRIERVMQRDSCSEQAVLKRIANQMPEEEKEQLSDFVIVNDSKE
ncbi:MAG: dephospho-CoA kinase, partial [Dehalococcoidaceae bacterium]|nr:dephospho-CoA kinase [Dehalococcoidaceae bacterium]